MNHMQDHGEKTSNSEQTTEPEPDSQPWARFEETVAQIVRVPLELTKQHVTDATQELTRGVKDLSSLQRNFADDLENGLNKLNGGLMDVQEQANATAAGATGDLAVHGEAISRLADQVNGATAAFGTRLDVAVEAVKQEIEKAAYRLAAQIQQSHDELHAAQVRELTSRIAALGHPLQAIEAEVRTTEERTSKRQEGAIASLREAIGKELSAASQRSSDADQALARSLTHLRRTSYALLALLTALATALLVITTAS
jgi:uncharacterized phage infection (PIP) family protein YhgE